MEEIFSKLRYTKIQTKQRKPKVIPTFFVTILTLLTLTTFTAMSSNVDKVEAQTVIDSDCQPNSPSTVDCDVAIDYDGNCNPNAPNCDIRINVQANPQPDGNNELRLDYILETGIYCNDVAGGSAGKTACLANSLNEYDNNVIVNRAPGTTSDNQFNFIGSQQVRETAGQDNFKATNDMEQRVTIDTGPANTGSVIDTDGDGDNFKLEYLQDIVHPDDTTNTNKAYQLVSLEALGGGKIDTTDHSELGFRVEQRLIDIDDSSTNMATTPVTAKNEANQVLGIDSDNGAVTEYDTKGLSLVSQTIDDCSFGTADCLNFAGTPGDTSFTNGQRVQLYADGSGTTLDVDNLRQILNQNIDNFENANGDDAINRVVDGQLFVAKATQGGDIDMALSDVTEQTQSLSQSIINSDENTINEVVKPNAAVFTPLTPTQAQQLGFAGSAGQAIYIGEDPTTPLDPTTATTESVKGFVEADVDQELVQSISGVTDNDNLNPTARNSGTMVMTLLAKDGLSELFVEGFDQYLRQTATSCNNCANNGAVSATFEVNGDSTLTLKPGSIQGLTQTVTQDNRINTNAVISKITVSGTGTDATIGLNQQISNTNAANNGNSIFTGTYTADANQNCNINQNGAFTQASSVCS